ncbi:hypothetical protein EVAR_42029_1 [Eumeta japonica]|uniref:Uncharacterized protein n=1 Tax=Eumeta variegata TaxID=151549 RepID=A0A4C1Y9F0_EUMVA|nr:hypothetical protein EVAR_42029_1 [Eumeta japonica]
MPGEKRLLGAIIRNIRSEREEAESGNKLHNRINKKGEVNPPSLIPLRQLQDLYANASSEFIVLISATLKVYKATCEEILGLYLKESGCTSKNLRHG